MLCESLISSELIKLQVSFSLSLKTLIYSILLGVSGY